MEELLGKGKGDEGGRFLLKSGGSLGEFLACPYVFTHEDGEAQRKLPRVTQLLLAELRPSGLEFCPL